VISPNYLRIRNCHIKGRALVRGMRSFRQSFDVGRCGRKIYKESPQTGKGKRTRENLRHSGNIPSNLRTENLKNTEYPSNAKDFDRGLSDEDSQSRGKIRQVKILNVEFVKSATQPSGYPLGNLPEVAFVGRSNVGKSSLINALLNRKQLARTSNTPGRTQIINFFNVNNELMFVDLPGYGFARVPEAVKREWGP